MPSEKPLPDWQSSDGAIQLYRGDCLEVLPKLELGSVDSVITDPPYGLKFMGKGWDHGIPGVDFWTCIMRVCKPGAILLAFGGTRTHHRLWCAIEDAGFEIRDCIMWLYGSGFPKSLDISKAIDKAAGVKREVIGERLIDVGIQSGSMHAGRESKVELQDITVPATEAAKAWNGWGTALKPAWENIICAQKPLTEGAERGIIVENLLTLEAKLWSLLPAKVVAKRFKLSRADYNAVCVSARWNADERSSTRAALLDQTDMSQYVSAVISSLSTVSLWRNILVESCEQTRMSTISMATASTIDWKILGSYLSVLTPLSIIQAELQEPGSRSSAVPAARYLNAVCLNISSIRELSVLGSAIAKGHILPLGDLGLVPNWEPICVAMRPLDGTFAENALKHGVAGLNVDGGRTGTPPPSVPQPRFNSATGCIYNMKTGVGRSGEMSQAVQGRWPANVIHDGSEEVVELRKGKIKAMKGFGL